MASSVRCCVLPSFQWLRSASALLNNFTQHTAWRRQAKVKFINVENTSAHISAVAYRGKRFALPGSRCLRKLYETVWPKCENTINKYISSCARARTHASKSAVGLGNALFLSRLCPLTHSLVLILLKYITLTCSTAFRILSQNILPAFRFV